MPYLFPHLYARITIMMNLIKQYVRTTKSTRCAKRGQYVFSVDVRLTKPQIKKLCEEHFGVEILSVNTHIKPVKKKRFGLKQGYKPRSKHAVITLKKGQRLFVDKEKEEKEKAEKAAKAAKAAKAEKEEKEEKEDKSEA